MVLMLLRKHHAILVRLRKAISLIESLSLIHDLLLLLLLLPLWYLVMILLLLLLLCIYVIHTLHHDLLFLVALPYDYL